MNADVAGRASLPSRATRPAPRHGAPTASLYTVSRATLYRLLLGERRAKDAHRADRGQPCEIVAAPKVRTTNKKGRCLSNARILELLVEHGV